MYTIKLVTGDNLWSNEGIHVCDENGIVIIVKEDVELQIEDENTFNNVKTILTDERLKRGVDENGKELDKVQQSMESSESYMQTQSQIQELTSEINNLKNLILTLTNLQNVNSNQTTVDVETTQTSEPNEIESNTTTTT